MGLAPAGQGAGRDEPQGRLPWSQPEHPCSTTHRHHLHPWPRDGTRPGPTPCPALPCVTHTPPLFELPGDGCQQDAGCGDVGTDSGGGAWPPRPAVTQGFASLRPSTTKGQVLRQQPPTAPAPGGEPAALAPGRLLLARSCRGGLPLAPAARALWHSGAQPSPSRSLLLTLGCPLALVGGG